MFIFSRTFTGNKVRRPRRCHALCVCACLWGITWLSKPPTTHLPSCPACPTSAAASTLPCARLLLLHSPFMPAQLKARLSVSQQLHLHHPIPPPAPFGTFVHAFRLPPPSALFACPTACFRRGSSRMPDCRVRFEFCRTSCYGIAQSGVH